MDLFVPDRKCNVCADDNGKRVPILKCKDTYECICKCNELNERLMMNDILEEKEDD